MNLRIRSQDLPMAFSLRHANTKQQLWFLVTALALGACVTGCQEATAEDPLQVLQQPAIYGFDDRTDLFEFPDPVWREVATRSVVALIPTSRMRVEPPNDVIVSSQTLGDSRNLCPNERFRNQPTAAACSATLIDDDLILTAGHCVTSPIECAEYFYVFGYAMEDAERLATIQHEDVFTCRQLITTNLGDNTDWAIIQLDRPVSSRQRPAKIQREARPVPRDTPLTMMGFGSGLPNKIDRGGRVIDSRATTLDIFVATPDAFQGNSGSGIFTNDQTLVGLLVSGAEDYITSPVGNCQTVATFDESGVNAGEQIVYAHNPIRELCQLGWPSEALCSTTPSCGDGFCTIDETQRSCPDDCTGIVGLPPAWRCERSFFDDRGVCDCGCGAFDPDCQDGNVVLHGCFSVATVCDDAGVCAPGQRVPSSWTCGTERYGDGSQCDCDCGSYDPDCDRGELPIVGCEGNQFCNLSGQCLAAIAVNPIPTTWRCNPTAYNSGERCDCDCGAVDPDCQFDARAFNCAAVDTCNALGQCEPPPEVPDMWTCQPDYYNVGDDCDCNCGAFDPDCNDPTLTTFGCLLGQTCNAEGQCIGQPLTERDIGGLCQATRPRVPLPAPPLALILVLLLAWRRRGTSA